MANWSASQAIIASDAAGLSCLRFFSPSAPLQPAAERPHSSDQGWTQPKPLASLRSVPCVTVCTAVTLDISGPVERVRMDPSPVSSD